MDTGGRVFFGQLDTAHSTSTRSLICPSHSGTVWDESRFCKTVARIRKRAGLPDELQIRDLRRTRATELGDAGATPYELMSVGGWQDVKSVQPYLLRSSSQANNAMKKRWQIGERRE